MSAMKIVMNGAGRDVPQGATLAELIRDLKLEDRSIAVEVNRSVVPRLRYGTTALSEGDRVEIVTFVGGG